MKIVLNAKSSSPGKKYDVEFEIVDGKLSVFCDCPAGVWGKFCKHKWQLLHGDQKMLFDESQFGDLKKVEDIAKEKDVGLLYAQVTLLEKESKGLGKILKKEKSKIIKILEKPKILSEEEFVVVRNELVKIENEIEYKKYLISIEKKSVEKQLKEGF